MPFEHMLNYWILQMIAIAVTAAIIPGLRITSIFGAVLMVAGLALANATMWDAALFMSIPQSASLQAFMLLFSNGILFWVLVKLLPGIEVRGVLPAIAAPVVFTVFSLIISHYLKDVSWIAVGTAIFEQIQEWRGQFQTPVVVPETL